MRDKMSLIPPEEHKIELTHPKVQEQLDTRKKKIITFVRHTQKASGAVFAETGSALATSSISSGGQKRANFFGEILKMEGRQPKSAGVTKNERTIETTNAILAGAESGDKKIRNDLNFGVIKGSQKFYEKYELILNEEKDKILAREFPNQEFKNLTPDEQEMIMEEAEEPALEWWLGLKDKKFDAETDSPKEAAAKVALKLSRFINATGRTEDGEDIDDSLAVGHKTSTEAFLAYCVLLPGEKEIDEEELLPANKIKKMGGSMKILGYWDMEITSDTQGQKQVKFYINHKFTEYGIDLNKLEELAKLGESLEQQEKNIT